MQSLNHKEPNCVPIDLGATIVSSIVKKTYIMLSVIMHIYLRNRTE